MGISIFSKALGDMNVPRGLLSKTFKDGEKVPAGSEMDNQTVEKNAFTPTRDIALPALKAGKKKKIKFAPLHTLQPLVLKKQNLFGLL